MFFSEIGPVNQVLVVGQAEAPVGNAATRVGKAPAVSLLGLVVFSAILGFLQKKGPWHHLPSLSCEGLFSSAAAFNN